MSRRRQLLPAAIAAVVLVGMGAAAFLWLGDFSLPTTAALRRHGYLGALLLLYIEESGLPLLVPGDAFVIYLGHRMPDAPPAWIAVWLALIAAVTLGATNLYLISRALGRRLLEHPLARFLHLSHARLDAAEQRFRRWGPWAVLLGRHLPGMRIPITVACGVLRMPYRVFAPCVAVSTAIWAGLFLGLGATFGEEAGRLLGQPAARVVVIAGAVAVAGAYLLVRVQGGDHPLARRPLAGVAFAAAQGLLLAADVEAGSRAALGVLAVLALLPAGWLLGGRASAVVLITFVCARLVDYGLGGNTALTAVAELCAGAASMVAARAAAGSGWRARAQVAREASHDLRTPLTVLHGYISMLEDGSFPRERTQQLVTVLSNKTREMNERIDAMLERLRVSS